MDKIIKTHESTKNRLDALKGRKSYNTLLEEMLSYFEQTGITPSSRITSPDAVMKEQSSRVIEVMKGVEKKQNITLDSIFQLLKSVSLGTQNSEETEAKKQDLLEQHKKLKESYFASEEKNKSHLIEIELLKAKTTSVNLNESVNSNILLEITEQIDTLKKTATFNSGIYEIERVAFDAWIARLKNELTR
jgi:hypothetical protein